MQSGGRGWEALGLLREELPPQPPSPPCPVAPWTAIPEELVTWLAWKKWQDMAVNIRESSSAWICAANCTQRIWDSFLPLCLASQLELAKHDQAIRFLPSLGHHGCPPCGRAGKKCCSYHPEGSFSGRVAAAVACWAFGFLSCWGPWKKFA